MRDHGLGKTQVSRHLLNYKKEMFGFQQSAIILNASSVLELEQMICDGMSMTTYASICDADLCTPMQSRGPIVWH